MRALATILVATIGVGCATLNNTVDKSRTVADRSSQSSPITGIAIPMIPENAAAEGLAGGLSDALPTALEAALPGVQLVPPETFGTSLHRYKGYLAHFAQWRSTYEQTGVIDPKPLPYYAKAAGGVSHILLVRSTSLDREKVSVRDALSIAPCRRAFCSIRDANNIWATHLKVLAELIDVGSGAVAWRGVGETVRIQEGSPRLDFGLLVVHGSKGAGVEQLASQMVGIAAEGIAAQLSGSAIASVGSSDHAATFPASQAP